MDKNSEMAEVKLFGASGSPFSGRVEIALKLKGVKHEFIREILSQKSGLLLQYNPIYKKVPVLVHKGKPIVESAIILEYIDETWKHNPILPQDPYERAIARFWVNFIDKKCTPEIWKACWTKEKDREKAMEEARQHLKTLEKELKGKRFFGGENIGVVDICATYIAFWVGALEDASGVKVLTEEKFPILRKWIKEYVNCIVVKQCLPSREKLVAYLRTRGLVSKL